jgi:hypothetical protein
LESGSRLPGIGTATIQAYSLKKDRGVLIKEEQFPSLEIQMSVLHY